jgi:hypothetical protein
VTTCEFRRDFIYLPHKRERPRTRASNDWTFEEVRLDVMSDDWPM